MSNSVRKRRTTMSLFGIAAMAAMISLAHAAPKKSEDAQPEKKLLTEDQVSYPPKLPGGATVVTDTSPDFLKRPATLKEGVAIAKEPPTVDFLYYPGQDYVGRPWSNWGDSLAVNGQYYSAIGDHLAIGAKGDGANGTGNAFVYAYDPEAKSIKVLTDVAKTLNLPAGHYTPGKIHSRLDLASDGWIYFATHRGSARSASDQYHYEGDWILRADPKSGRTEIVTRGPIPKHSTPNSVVDPDRLIFYGGTAAGPDAKDQSIQFFAYDLTEKKLLYSGPDGPGRYMILAKSTGKLYYVPDVADGQLMRYDPATNKPPAKVAGATMGIRAATQETADGFVYAVSSGQGREEATIWSLNTKTEEVRNLGTSTVGSQAYTASIDVDPTGRYLYYVPGAHGSSPADNSAVVQFDVRTGKKKVIAFLHPFYEQKYGGALRGTYATAMDPAGDGSKLFVTWNVSRGTKAWDSCGLTVIHIPASERNP